MQPEPRVTPEGPELRVRPGLRVRSVRRAQPGGSSSEEARARATGAADPAVFGTTGATGASDPPASGTTGATGASDPPASGTTGATGASDPPASGTGTGDPPSGDPLTAPIDHNNLLGGLQSALWKFLHGAWSTMGLGGDGWTVSGSPDSLGHGEHQGLTPPLTGGQLMTDLANIGKLGGVAGYGSNDPNAGSAHPPTPNFSGIGGFGNPDNGGKPEFKDLMSQNPDIGPKH